MTNSVSPMIQTHNSASVAQPEQLKQAIAQTPTLTCHLITDEKGVPALLFSGAQFLGTVTMSEILRTLQRPSHA